MAQINLLKQQKESTSDILQTVTSISVKVLAFALLAVVMYYGYLYFNARAKTKKISDIQATIAAEQKDLGDPAERSKLFTRQQQLQELMKLVSSHPYWSSLLPVLAKSTLNSANYMKIQALTDGTLSLSVTVPSNEDLDKYLQVFDLPQFYNNFYDIRIGSISKTQVGNTLMTQFDVTMKFNTAILQKNGGAK